MRSVSLTWFGILAAIVFVFATMAYSARTNPGDMPAPGNVRAYGAVHGVVIPPYNG